MGISNFNQNISKIVEFIEVKKFDEAIISISKLKDKLQSEIYFNLLGLVDLKKGNFKLSLEKFKQAIEVNSKYLSAYINVSSAYEKLEDYVNAEHFLNLAIKLNPQSDAILNSLGYILYKQNKIKDSIVNFEKAININCKNYKAFFNLGNSLNRIGNFHKAIDNFKKTIEINKNSPEVYFNLAELLKTINEPEDALFNYKISLQEKTSWLRREKINAKILECYLILNRKKDYMDTLTLLSKDNPNNRRIAATSNFIAHQFKIKNVYPFCPNPFELIYKSTLSQYFDNFDDYLHSLFIEITSEHFKWEPSGKTTRNGYGTVGNLSDKKLPLLSKLEDCIRKELVSYFNLHKDKEITFITNRPSNFNIVSWSNRLKKEGFNISHIHPGGWVSGVFYLKIPTKIKDDESGIEFSLHGDDYHIVNKNIPSKILLPKVGDIILFPSSLFHKTIPFESDEERVCIAFDLCKND